MINGHIRLILLTSHMHSDVQSAFEKVGIEHNGSYWFTEDEYRIPAGNVIVEVESGYAWIATSKT